MITGQPRFSGLGSFYAGNVLFGAGLFFHAFLYNFYLEALGHSETVMGYAAAALTAGGLAALLPAGRLVDTLGSRAVLWLAAIGGGVGLAVGAVATQPALVYAAAVAAGAGTGAWRVAQGPMLMSVAPEAFRSRAFSWNVGLLVGTGGLWILAAGSVTGWLEGTLGLSALGALRTALLAGAAATSLSVPLFILLPRPRAARESRPAAAKPARPIPAGIGVLVLLVMAWMFAPALVTPFFNLYFSREYVVAVDRISWIFAAAHAVTALAIFASGEWATRIGPRRALAGWMLLFAPAMLALASVGSLVPAVALYLVQGFVSPATNPLIDQILLELAPEERRGAVASWRNAATEGSGAGGAAFGGRILDGGSFAELFVVAGVVGLSAAAALIWGLNRQRAAALATE